jgi:hypothetical protein
MIRPTSVELDREEQPTLFRDDAGRKTGQGFNRANQNSKVYGKGRTQINKNISTTQSEYMTRLHNGVGRIGEVVHVRRKTGVIQTDDDNRLTIDNLS